MSSHGNRKKGRENKKPKQAGTKIKTQSAYAARQTEPAVGGLKIRSK